MAIVNGKKFPTITALQKVYPSAIAKLPDNYEGLVENDSLAYSLGSALETSTFADLQKIKITIPAYMTTRNERQYAREYLRFGLALDDVSSYYDFLNIFDKEALSVDEIYYTVSLASAYSGRRLTSVLSVFKSIYDYQVNVLERNPKEIVMPKISEFENLFDLTKVLRSEGITMEHPYLWIASSHWPTAEVLQMIEEGLHIRRAMELYTMGFTSMDEIIEYSGILPDSWLDRIMNGPPKNEND